MPASAAPSPLPTSAAINLRRLVVIRAIAVAGQGIAIWVAVVRLGMLLPLRELVGILVAMSVLALGTLLRLRLPFVVRDGELFAHLLADVAALTGVLYYSGGGSNPFVTLYLVPLAFAAAALPAAHAWAMAGLSAACYTLLLFFNVPLPESHAGHAHDFGLHVLGMWLGFVLAAGLIAGFAVRMSATLRERDRLAAEMREREIRQERVLALGTLAAGAAHELGTPLSTMAVLVNDLAPDRPVSADKLAILRTQIGRCKDILSSLSATAGQPRAEGGARLPLDAWLSEILRKWQAMRPGVGARTFLAGAQPAPQIVAEQTLAQAITNILNNAADASPEIVEIEGHWNERQLTLEVADRGPGLAPEVQAAVGETPVTTKPAGAGLGLGLFLAYTTLSRFGGTVRLSNREGGGVLCRLELPLDTLKVAA
jgi:two-component system sensor histidine kinase RegB